MAGDSQKIMHAEQNFNEFVAVGAVVRDCKEERCLSFKLSRAHLG